MAEIYSEEELDLKLHIIREADNLFSQYGIKSVTMDDIAKHLGMSKKTIYQHFTDKNDLLKILMKSKMQSQVCIMNEGSSIAKDAVHELFHAVTNMQTLLSNINPVMFYDLQKYHPEAWAFFKEFREKHLYNKIKHNLERGMEEGYYRPEINLEIITKMRLNQVDFVFNQPANPGQKYTVSQAMTEITEHYLYGVCTLKGHKLINKYKHIIEEE